MLLKIFHNYSWEKYGHITNRYDKQQFSNEYSFGLFFEFIFCMNISMYSRIHDFIDTISINLFVPLVHFLYRPSSAFILHFYAGRKFEMQDILIRFQIGLLFLTQEQNISAI